MENIIDVVTVVAIICIFASGFVMGVLWEREKNFKGIE